MNSQKEDTKGFLIIEPPSQVRFNGPFTRPVVTTLTLINPTDFKIIFKIKTTAPTFYGVRPNFGVVQPRNFTEVEIARKPFVYDQNEKNNHKFMVQSLIAPSDAEDLNSIWENADTAQLKSSKLRCVFEPFGTDLRVPSPIKTSLSMDASRASEKQDSEEAFAKRQLETLSSELRQMRTENNVLRKENVMLKDEIEQIRNMPIKREFNTPPPGKTDLLKEQPKPVPFIYILSSVTMAIICILLGKFVL